MERRKLTKQRRFYALLVPCLALAAILTVWAGGPAAAAEPTRPRASHLALAQVATSTGTPEVVPTPTQTSMPSPATPAPAPIAGTMDAVFLAAGERYQVIQFNPGAALQKRIFADGFVPNSSEFSQSFQDVPYVAQRAENLRTGAVRVYYVVRGDWANVVYAQRGTAAGALDQTLLTLGEQYQVMQFNPDAALQKRIFADGFVPNSAEFRVAAGGADYVAQRAEALGTGAVRVYYVPVGQWDNIATATRL